MSYGRVILLIADACGVGPLPDAAYYGDSGAATIPNLAASVDGLTMPTCQRLGLGNIADIQGLPAGHSPLGCFGKMAEKSVGKDSISGHWEIAGVILDKPFPVFPTGFPRRLIKRFEERAGVGTIGNVTASGTEIIERLGEKHLQTKALILYTSADSVLQLAAHESIYPPERLYEICRVAREVCRGEYGVGRVIARPFTGQPGNFVRTVRRKDFSLPASSDTVLDMLVTNGTRVLAIGKVWDLFTGRGISERIKADDNSEVMKVLRERVEGDRRSQLIFATCVDFDQLWGHRNDEKGFASGLEDFDEQLGRLLPLLRGDDLLIITADHGCDPTIKSSTDHTREYVPLLAYGQNARKGVDLGTRETFADIAATVVQVFALPNRLPGTSFLDDIVQPKAPPDE